MKKISFTWILFSCVLIGVGIYTYNFIYDNYLIKDVAKEIEESIEINSVYTYSPDEIDNFKNMTPRKNDPNGKGAFNNSILYFSHVFNENLSLKDPTLFSGRTYVDDDFIFFNVNKIFNDSKAKFSNQFYPALKYFDKKFKDSDGVELRNIIDKSISEGTSNIFGNFGFDIDALKDDIVLTDTLMIEKFLNDKDKTSTLPLIAFLNAKPFYHHFFDYNVPVKEKFNYFLFPEKYNYFPENNNYYVNYYPTKVTKVKEKTYIVDVETDKPLDRSGAALLFDEIYQRFDLNSGYTPTFETADDIPFVLAVRLNHKGLSGEMLPEYTLRTITPIFYNDSTGSFTAIKDFMFGAFEGTMPDWYPNEQAQPWVKDFFSELNYALDTNSRFSIFETIENIAANYNADYIDVENVILSFYWRYILL